MKKENLIKDSKRIVIKIGSSLLIDKNNDSLKSEWLRSLAQEINQLIKQKKEIIIVSSGSIALGQKQLKLRGNLSLDEKQAAAATGQVSLAHAWKEIMEKFGLNIAQILLKEKDINESIAFLDEILNHIVNENIDMSKYTLSGVSSGSWNTLYLSYILSTCLSVLFSIILLILSLFVSTTFKETIFFDLILSISLLRLSFSRRNSAFFDKIGRAHV